MTWYGNLIVQLLFLAVGALMMLMVVGWGPANMLEAFGVWCIQAGSWLGKKMVSGAQELRKSQALRAERNQERMEEMRKKYAGEQSGLGTAAG